MISLERNGALTPFGKFGKLSVKGSKLAAQNGEPCTLRGISTHNLNTYPEYASDETLTYLVDTWGISMFRLAMYSAEADDCKGYADSDDAYRAQLEDLIVRNVKKAAELGIYVLVDWHILFDYDPNMNKDMAKQFFASISKKLAAYDNVVYEVCNEPNMDTTWEQVKSYCEEVIPIIRENAPEAVIAVGTPTWSQDIDKAAENPLAFDNLVYVIHFYATTHKQWLRDKADAARKKGLAVFVTEYGICDASGNGEVDYEETAAWMRYLNDNHISYMLWNLSNKDESSAMITPTCKKLSGFTEDDLSACGKWFVQMMKEYQH